MTFSQANIDWDRPFVEPCRVYVPILSPKVGSFIKAVVINDDVVRVPTHWFMGRTIPCVGKANHCEGCSATRTVRWKWYLGVWLPETARVCMLEVTADAQRNANLPLDPPQQQLRGLQVKAWRLGKAPTGPCRVEVCGIPIEEGAMPRPLDIKEALCKIWNGSSRQA